MYKLVCSKEASFGISICNKNSPLSDLGKNSKPIYPPANKPQEDSSNKTIETSVMALCLSVHSNNPVIHLVNFASCFSNQRMNLPKAFLPSIFSNLPKREKINGTIVNDATNDNNVAIITTTQN
ncbi:hypothetical protein D3C85_1253830 [compost metagenome]